MISQKQALILMIALLSLVMLFHLSILAQLIPYSIVWAGKLNNIQEMRMFESVSIFLILFHITVLLLKANYIKNKIPTTIINIILWGFVGLFTINTVGNLFAKTAFELYFFTALSFISALLSLRILVNGGKK